MNTYQIMPKLSADEYSELKADIKEHNAFIKGYMDTIK